MAGSPERSHDGFSDPLGPTGNEDSSCFMECLRIVTGSCPGGFPDLILLVFFFQIVVCHDPLLVERTNIVFN